MKYYIRPSYDDVDLNPTWQVRKKLFWIFSSFECEFDTKHDAIKLCNHLNQIDNLKEWARLNEIDSVSDHIKYGEKLDQLDLARKGDEK